MSLKRKSRKSDLQDDLATGFPQKKLRSDLESQVLPSPKRRAFARECKFTQGEKVIGFYGGWPYVGTVHCVARINMSFGATYLLNIRWNGFSGKNSNSWISEFDVIKHDQAGLKLKSDMEQSQRELLDGLKVDSVKQKKIFLKVVSEYRGKRLAPFAPHTAPFPDEWQTIIRVTAIPKTLTQHLKRCEDLISERRLCLGGSSDDSVEDVLSRWASSDEGRCRYAKLIEQLFNKFFIGVLVHKFELPVITKDISDSKEFSKTFGAQFLLRFLVIFPEILTAACVGVLRKGPDNEPFDSLVQFLNYHQSFVGYLEDNIEALLQAPARKATLDEPVPESEWLDLLEKDEAITRLETRDPICSEQEAPRSKTTKLVIRTKRKCSAPRAMIEATVIAS